jgi:DNA repair exonuclease SbcCD ATPase subunit
MRLSFLTGLMLGLLLPCCGGVLVASEIDALRARAKVLHSETSLLTDRGDMEKATKLKKEAVNLLEEAQRLELEGKGPEKAVNDKVARHLKEHLQDLLAMERKLTKAKASDKELGEVRKQIAGTERKLDSVRARKSGMAKFPLEVRPQVEKLEAASRRIHHFRVAAENLKLAEAHDLARELIEKAEAMEREVNEAKAHLATQMQNRHGGEQGLDVVRELRAEVERLRAEVKELRKQVENR